MVSILTSIKKLMGIEAEYTHFDQDLIIHINSAFMVLSQIGVGSFKNFMIHDESTKWDDFIGDQKDLEIVKAYIYLKVRLAFDPPQTGFLIEAISKQITEIEWRLNAQSENG